MVLTTMNVTGKKYTTRVYSTYIAICLPKWTDDATPLTVLCGLACFQLCSPVRRSGILREITCVIRPLNSTVLNVQLKTSLFVHYQAQRIEHNRDIMTKRFINLQFSIYLLTCSINPEYTECGKITLVLPKSFTCGDSRSGNKVGLIYSFRSNSNTGHASCVRCVYTDQKWYVDAPPGGAASNRRLRSGIMYIRRTSRSYISRDILTESTRFRSSGQWSGEIASGFYGWWNGKSKVRRKKVSFPTQTFKKTKLLFYCGVARMIKKYKLYGKINFIREI